jgi:excisionase family DNA binding protein
MESHENQMLEMNHSQLHIENLIPFKELIERGIFKKGTLYYLTSNKIIPFIKIGRNIMFNKPELEQWISNRRVTGGV